MIRSNEMLSVAGWSVDPSTHRISRNGEWMKLEPRTMEVLLYLARHAGEAVTRQELEESVWRGMVVGYDSLSKAINKLRKAFGDDPGRPRIIETIPKVGYRLIGEVSAASMNQLELPEKPSIAVLPFTNMSGDAEQEYISDGITEDIITALSYWRSLKVIARNSTFAYKGQCTHPSQLQRELGVRYVLEGSVRRSKERFRVTTQLVGAADGATIWAQRYDRAIADIFQLQDDITTNVATAIDPAIRAAEHVRVQRKPPQSLGAWDHVLKGQWLAYKYRKESNAEARREFQMAIDLDPSFAAAHSWLAYATFLDGWLLWVEDPKQAFEQAHASARRAVALDDNDAQAHAHLSWVSVFVGRIDAAIASADRAVALNPNYAYAWDAKAMASLYAGEPEAVIDPITNAIRLSPNDPFSWVFYGMLAQGHYFSKQYEEAIAAARRAIKIRHGYIYVRSILAAALAQAGYKEEAADELAKLFEIQPEFSPMRIDHFPLNQVMRMHYLNGLREAGLST